MFRCADVSFTALVSKGVIMTQSPKTPKIWSFVLMESSSADWKTLGLINTVVVRKPHFKTIKFLKGQAK